MNINQRIKIEMTSRGWTVYKLSKITGISKSAINGWFKEIPTAPNYKSIRLVAKAFNMKAEDLVSEKKDADPQKQEMLELWNRLETAEKDAVIGVMKTIIEHNK